MLRLDAAREDLVGEIRKAQLAAEDLEKITRPFAERRMDRGIRAALAGQNVDALRI